MNFIKADQNGLKCLNCEIDDICPFLSELKKGRFSDKMKLASADPLQCLQIWRLNINKHESTSQHQSSAV